MTTHTINSICKKHLASQNRCLVPHGERAILFRQTCNSLIGLKPMLIHLKTICQFLNYYGSSVIQTNLNPWTVGNE